jgi:hypothetical protein
VNLFQIIQCSSSAGRNKTILTFKKKMSAKCTSQNCNRKPESTNSQNLCVLCYDWFLKCQQQSQTYQKHNQANYQELLSIYNNLSSGIVVDQNQMMRALIGSMMNLMSQNSEIVKLQQENSNLNADVKDLNEELGETKLKFYNLEYNFKEAEKKNLFSPADTLVIRNLAIPQDGDDLKVVKEDLAQLIIEDFDPDEDILEVERKGHLKGKLGSIFVKVQDEDLKRKIMKKKKELLNSTDPELKKLKIMNFKTQEQILYENALRNVLSIVPNGNLYEINGNMRLVSKQ